MEDDNEDDVGFGLQLDEVLEYEDEVVEGHEANDSNEMRIDEFAAADLAIGHCYYLNYFYL